MKARVFMLVAALGMGLWLTGCQKPTPVHLMPQVSSLKLRPDGDVQLIAYSGPLKMQDLERRTARSMVLKKGQTVEFSDGKMPIRYTYRGVHKTGQLIFLRTYREPGADPVEQKVMFAEYGP